LTLINSRIAKHERVQMSEATSTTEQIDVPAWLAALDSNDVQFIKRFVLASGSLKEIATIYGVSYPTVRARLDRLIEKVKLADDSKISDPFQRKLRMLMADGQISADLAKQLLAVHRQSLKGGKENG
jgi:hypothetical protein